MYLLTQFQDNDVVAIAFVIFIAAGVVVAVIAEDTCCWLVVVVFA